MTERETIEVGDLVECTGPAHRGERFVVHDVIRRRDGKQNVCVRDVGVFGGPEVRLLARARHIDAGGLPQVASAWRSLGDGSIAHVTRTADAKVWFDNGLGTGWRTVDLWFRDFRPVDMAPAAKDRVVVRSGSRVGLSAAAAEAARQSVTALGGNSVRPDSVDPKADDERVWAVRHTAAWARDSWLRMEDADDNCGAWGASADRFTRAEAEALAADSSFREVVRHPDCPEPAFPTCDNRTAPRRVLRPGPDVHDVAPGEQVVLAEPGAYRIRSEIGERTYTVDPKQPGMVTLQPEARGAVYPLTFVEPAPLPVQPRCGQRWRNTEKSDRPGVIATLIDFFDVSTMRDGEPDSEWLVRVEGATRRIGAGQHLEFARLGFIEFLDGPTAPETPREALERVIKLEAENVPDGVTSGEWLRLLLSMTENRDGAPMALPQVRELIAHFRETGDVPEIDTWASEMRTKFRNADPKRRAEREADFHRRAREAFRTKR